MMEDNMTPGAEKENLHESTQSLIEDFSKPAQQRNIDPPPVVEHEEKKEEPKKEGVEAKKYISSELSADILVGSIDTVQTLVFSAINRRKMRRRFGEDMDRLEILVDKIDDGVVQKEEIPDTDRILLKRIRKLIAVYDNIPFSDEEKEELKKPLAEIIKESGYKIPPGVALTIAVVTLLSSRIADAFTE